MHTLPTRPVAALAAILATVALWGAHAPAHATDDHRLPVVRAAAAPGPAHLSMTQVIDQLTRAGYSQIREVEWDDGRYEVEARNSRGQWVELDVDPVKGRVLRVELDD